MLYSASGTVEGVPVVPMTAMPHHLQPWHTTLPLLCPSHQLQTSTHTGRKKKNTEHTSPIPLLTLPRHLYLSSILIQLYMTPSLSPKHLPSPLLAAYTKLLSHHPNLNLTFPYPISFYSYCTSCTTWRPLVTGLAGDEREEFSVCFGFLLASPDCSLECAGIISLSALSNFTDNINMKRSLICSSTGPAGCHVVTLGPYHVIDGEDGACVLGPARNRC